MIKYSSNLLKITKNSPPKRALKCCPKSKLSIKSFMLEKLKPGKPLNFYNLLKSATTFQTFKSCPLTPNLPLLPQAAATGSSRHTPSFTLLISTHRNTKNTLVDSPPILDCPSHVSLIRNPRERRRFAPFRHRTPLSKTPTMQGLEKERSTPRTVRSSRLKAKKSALNLTEMPAFRAKKPVRRILGFGVNGSRSGGIWRFPWR